MTVAVCTTANSCAKGATSDCRIRLVVFTDVRMVADTNTNFTFPATCAHAYGHPGGYCGTAHSTQPI